MNDKSSKLISENQKFRIYSLFRHCYHFGKGIDPKKIQGGSNNEKAGMYPDVSFTADVHVPDRSS
jgi:hypothetical protein